MFISGTITRAAPAMAWPTVRSGNGQRMRGRIRPAFRPRSLAVRTAARGGTGHAAIGHDHHLGAFQVKGLDIGQRLGVIRYLAAKPFLEPAAYIRIISRPVAGLVMKLTVDQQPIPLTEGGHAVQ